MFCPCHLTVSSLPSTHKGPRFKRTDPSETQGAGSISGARVRFEWDEESVTANCKLSWTNYAYSMHRLRSPFCMLAGASLATILIRAQRTLNCGGP